MIGQWMNARLDAPDQATVEADIRCWTSIPVEVRRRAMNYRDMLLTDRTLFSCCELDDVYCCSDKFTFCRRFRELGGERDQLVAQDLSLWSMRQCRSKQTGEQIHWLIYDLQRKNKESDG